MEKTITKRNSSIVYISVMNVIAAVSVVILHANVSFWLDKSKPYWATANVIESVFYGTCVLYAFGRHADRLSREVFD